MNITRLSVWSALGRNPFLQVLIIFFMALISYVGAREGFPRLAVEAATRFAWTASILWAVIFFLGWKHAFAQNEHYQEYCEQCDEEEMGVMDRIAFIQGMERFMAWVLVFVTIISFILGCYFLATWAEFGGSSQNRHWLFFKAILGPILIATSFITHTKIKV